MARFDERAATQAAAFFLNKSNGKIDVMSILKLLYLADREACDKRGISITCDVPYSMDNGPVLSTIYDLNKGAMVRSQYLYWSQHISERDSDHNVSLLVDPGSSALSEVEVEILDRIWSENGNLSPWELSRKSHLLPEWEDPRGTSRIIPIAKILKALGKDEARIEEFEKRERELDSENSFLSEILGRS